MEEVKQETVEQSVGTEVVAQEAEVAPPTEPQVSVELQALIQDLKQLSRVFRIVTLLAPLQNNDVQESLQYLSALHKATLDEALIHPEADIVPALAEAKKKELLKKDVSSEQPTEANITNK